MTPSESELTNAIESATRTAVLELFSHCHEHFYYLSLVTDGKANPPALSAWSIESLDRAVEKFDDKEEAIWNLKWSYADSPYFCYGEEYFELVEDLFNRRPRMTIEMTDEDWDTEYDLRMRAMETALHRLDESGLFGSGSSRFDIVINVEVNPPDSSNTKRAWRLNPPQALETWLSEAAERDE